MITERRGAMSSPLLREIRHNAAEMASAFSGARKNRLDLSGAARRSPSPTPAPEAPPC